MCIVKNTLQINLTFDDIGGKNVNLKIVITIVGNNVSYLISALDILALAVPPPQHPPNCMHSVLMTI